MKKLSTEHELLLRAALLQGPAAIEAWRAWGMHITPYTIDQRTVWLLPLMARNLESQGLNDPSLTRIHDPWRRIWARSTSRLTMTAEIVRLLQGAGIDTMILKGAALIVRHYIDPGVRPIESVEILVPYRQALTATALLRANGWDPVVKDAEARIPVTHGQGFRDRAGRKLDLHWHVMWECSGDADDDDFWSASVEARIDSVLTRALCPADQLLHVCVHGAPWNEEPPFRWVADASMILRTHGPQIDWDRLVRQARARRLVLPVRDSLEFLVHVLGAAVPADVLLALRRSPASTLEHVDYRLKLRPRRLWTRGAVLVCHHLRSTQGAGAWRRAMGLPRYLQQVFGLKSRRQLPGAVLDRLSRTISTQAVPRGD